jgi:pilus assembly protein CpaF
MMLALTLRDKDGGERQLSFQEDEITIGRMDGNDIVLARNNISKTHASVMVSEGKILVSDQRSTNGTYVNGRRITAPQELTPDDKIYIGDFVIQCHLATGAEETTSPETQAADPPPMPAVSAGPTDHLGAEAAVELASPPEPPAPPEPPPAPAVEAADGADEFDEFKEVLPESADGLMDELEDVQAEPLSSDEDVAPTDLDDEEEEEEATRALSLEDIAAIDAVDPPPAEEKEEEEEEEEATQALSVDDIAALDAAPDEPSAPAEQEVTADAEHAEPLLPPEDEPETPAIGDFEPVEEPSFEPVDEPAAEPPPTPEAVEVASAPKHQASSTFAIEDGLGILSSLFGDPSVVSVSINGVDGVMVDRGQGPTQESAPHPEPEELESLVHQLAATLGLEADDARFVLSGVLPSGLRVDVVGTDFSNQGPLVVARRPLSDAITPQALVDAGLEGAALESLATWIKDGSNIIIAGATGSGRTSVASACAQLIDANERIAIIERRKEIELSHANVVRLDRDACVASGSLGEVLESMKVSRVVFDDISGPGLTEFIGLAAVGYRGLIGVMKASSAEELLRRLPHELSFFGHAESGSRSQEWIADAIDVVVVTENHHIRVVLEVGDVEGNAIVTHILHGE